MFTQQKIKEIANSSETAKTLFKALSNRVRFRRETNLDFLYNSILASGNTVVAEEFMETFKKLEKAGVGSLVRGRVGNPDRFRWNYSLKEVAKAAFSNETIGPVVSLDQIPVGSAIPKARMSATGRMSRFIAPIKSSAPITITLNINDPSKVKDLDKVMKVLNKLSK